MKANPETLIFEEFEACSKVTRPKDKLRILQNAYKIDKKIFETIVYMVYGRDKYYVNEATIRKLKVGKKYTESFSNFVKLADKLKKRQLTGNAAIEALQNFWNGLDEFHAKWYGRILMKDLRIGVGTALLKQVLSLSNLQKVPSPMLAISAADLSENVLKKLLDHKKVLCEYKIDGFRCVSCVYDDHVECYTRNGTRIPYIEEIFLNEFGQLLKANIPKPFILDGEVYAKDWNVTMSFSPTRKTRLSPKQEQKLRYYLFDILPGDIKQYKNGEIVNIKQSTRKKRLKSIIGHVTTGRFIYVTGIEFTGSADEILKEVTKQTDKYLSQGWEGSVTKLEDAPYQWGKRPKYWLKFKKFETLDLLVVDVEPSLKRPNEIAALVVKYKGTTVRVAGLTDDQKKRWYEHPNEIIGKIVEVKHMGETVNQKLRHPTFVRVRFDKDTPDA